MSEQIDYFLPCELSNSALFSQREIIRYLVFINITTKLYCKYIDTIVVIYTLFNILTIIFQINR